MNFPNKEYSVIYADPPWSYRQHGTSPKSRGNAAQHYRTMNVEDICSLPPHWRKSEETPPKKKDGDVLGSVFAVAYHRNIRNGIWLASNMPWHIVADCPEMYPLWMPLPKLPDLPTPERRCMLGND